LENDEMCYNVDDLLPLCEELNIPLVFDYHHDWIFPSSLPPAELMPRILQTFYRKGIRPKQHLSAPRPGAVTLMEKRAHSDRCKTLPADLPDDVDLMCECKDKEQAVFELFRLYDLQPTHYASLRPPAEVETLKTNGRKSHTPKKKKLDDDEEGLENPEIEDPEVDGDMPQNNNKNKKKKQRASKKVAAPDGIEKDAEHEKDHTEDAGATPLATNKRKAQTKTAEEDTTSTESTKPAKKRSRKKTSMKIELTTATFPELGNSLVESQTVESKALELFTVQEIALSETSMG